MKGVHIYLGYHCHTPGPELCFCPFSLETVFITHSSDRKLQVPLRHADNKQRFGAAFPFPPPFMEDLYDSNH